MKKALVISGGGSKGAFAGGVAEYLMKEKNKDYDIYVGTSTGSLMVSHLALGMVDELKKVYTNVNQRTIFSNSPFRIRKVHGTKVISIKHISILWNFLRGKKTFGESKNLKKLIKRKVTKKMYDDIRTKNKEVVVTISNLTGNVIEYKSVLDNSYEDFCDWIWGSCNYVPFMSLLEKNGCQYADGGFGCLVPIREAILRGAKEIDAIILETEVTQINRLHAKNPFGLMLDVFDFMMESIEKHNVTIGKLTAKHKDVKLRIYYTPTVLTSNSLVFDKKLMTQWWKQGYEYAQQENDTTLSSFKPELIDKKDVEEGLKQNQA